MNYKDSLTVITFCLHKFIRSGSKLYPSASLVLACYMDFYDTDIYIQQVYVYIISGYTKSHETLQLWLPLSHNAV